MDKKKIVIGISGASGTPISIALLQALRRQGNFETHLVITNGAIKTIKVETGFDEKQVGELADFIYDITDIGAAIASGTFKTEGMAVVPCSMKSVAGLAVGYTDNLLLRAADVTLKERRKLVLVTRETPLHSIHLHNMLTLSEAGAVILPPMLSYYQKETDIVGQTNHIVGKILDQFLVDYPDFNRWNPERKTDK